MRGAREGRIVRDWEEEMCTGEQGGWGLKEAAERWRTVVVHR